MSPDGKPNKKRCLVKVLDFENCVLAGTKSCARNRKRKRLRARVTRDVRRENTTPERGEEGEMSSLLSPVLMARGVPTSVPSAQARPSSPVFRCGNQGTTSAVIFRSKRKINFDGEESIESSNIERTSCLRSPVLSLKTSKSVMKEQQSANETSDGTNDVKVPADVKNLIPTCDGRFGKSDKLECRSEQEIEDFTQDYESNASVSPVESQNSDNATSSRFTRYRNDVAASLKYLETPTSHVGREKCHGGEENPLQLSRKNIKKYGLLHRLSLILGKQATEEHLWRHRQRRSVSSSTEMLWVADRWSVDVQHVLKCVSHRPETEIKYLVVEGKWIPQVEAGCSLRLEPPWQKIRLPETNVDVLLNVFCLEISNETRESFRGPQVEFETICTVENGRQRESSDVTLLYESLLCFHVSPFLY